MSVFSDNKDYFFTLGGVLLLSIVMLIILNRAGGDLDNIDTVLPDMRGQMSYQAPPEMSIDVNKDYKAIIKTNKGDIKVDLLERAAPITVNNFIFLSEEGFYKNNLFHRVISGFVLQVGDRNNRDGTGGPGYKFADEINWDSISLSTEQKQQLQDVGYVNTPGLTSVIMKSRVLAMANSGPNTNGSQFFIVSGSDSAVAHLNGRHTVFGTVVEGWELVQEMQNVEVDENDKPKKDLVIQDIEIITE